MSLRKCLLTQAPVAVKWTRCSGRAMKQSKVPPSKHRLASLNRELPYTSPVTVSANLLRLEQIFWARTYRGRHQAAGDSWRRWAQSMRESAKIVIGSQNGTNQCRIARWRGVVRCDPKCAECVPSDRACMTPLSAQCTEHIALQTNGSLGWHCKCKWQ